MRYHSRVLRLAFPLLALNFFTLPLRGGDEGQLEGNGSYRKGLAALSDHLPDLAIAPLTGALADFADDPAATITIQIRLGEAHVRAGRVAGDRATSGALGSSALAHLEPATRAGREEAVFWSAQAHILRSELIQASDLFSRLDDAQDQSLRNRALLSRAHLLAALGNPGEAGILLTKLAAQEEPRLALEARLLHATILLGEEAPLEAAALLNEEEDPENREQLMHVRYLRAQILARTDKRAAIEAFRSIVEDPEPVPHLLRHSAQVSLAECLQGTQQPVEAIEALINLIDRQPRTAMLEAAFHRLVNWSLTESLKNRVEQQLAAWANLPGSDPSSQPDKGEIILSPATASRSGYALYYRAIWLGQENSAESNQQARTLLNWLIKNMPRHASRGPAMLELAKLQISEQSKDEAIATLALLETSTSSARLRKESGRLLARLKFEKEDYQSAARAFLVVRDSFTSDRENISAINAGISLLRAGDDTGFGALLRTLEDSETRVTLLLERALYQSSHELTDARPELERFLRNHPQHPRLPAARLAIAEEYLRLEPNRESTHREVLEEIKSLEMTDLEFNLDKRRLLIQLRLAGLTGDWEPASAASKRFLKSHNPDRISSLIQLKISEAYFHNGNLSEAQGKFQEIANSTKEEALAETALFYAARAALKLNTAASREEATTLLRRVIANEGSLALDARLLLAHSQTEGEPREAIATLEPLLPEDSPVRLDALMLAADAHRELGDPASLRAALSIYDKVLAKPELAYPLSNRLFWLKGQVFEELGESRPALDAYYHVVRRENLPEGERPSEWYYFSRCAFDAVEILEQGVLPRWDAAVDILRKVEDSESPWRKEAGRRRAGIQLEYQLFESD